MAGGSADWLIAELAAPQSMPQATPFTPLQQSGIESPGVSTVGESAADTTGCASWQPRGSIGASLETARLDASMAAHAPALATG